MVKYFHYDIHEESECQWSAVFKENHYSAFPSITLTREDGVLKLCIGTHKVRIITIVGELKEKNIPKDCLILQYNLRHYQEITSNKPDCIINVNLKDVNSAERIAMYMRAILIGLHVKNIKQKKDSPQSMIFLHPESPVKTYNGDINYLMMNDYFVLKINEGENSAIFSNSNPKLKHLSFNDWGMDNIFISNYRTF